MFYLFGLILLLTAGHMLKPDGEDSPPGDNIMIRMRPETLPHLRPLRRRQALHHRETAGGPDADALVMAAIGGTDVLFALDSIPAIFGLTENVYIVFTATAFSLLGLRQLFFLIDGLLDRLIYLSYGLAAILAFIGVKLILHALHENNVPFINGGEPVHVVEISTGLSLSVIVGVLVVTVGRLPAQREGSRSERRPNARRHATQYLDLSYEADQRSPGEDVRGTARARRSIIRGLPEKYRRRIRNEHELMDLLQRAHAVKDERVAAGHGSTATRTNSSS